MKDDGDVKRDSNAQQMRCREPRELRQCEGECEGNAGSDCAESYRD